MKPAERMRAMREADAKLEKSRKRAIKLYQNARRWDGLAGAGAFTVFSDANPWVARYDVQMQIVNERAGVCLALAGRG